MGLAYNALDDDDDVDAYDLSQAMKPSARTGVKTDPKKLKEEPGFFSGSSTAVQRGVKAGLGKVAVSLMGTGEENQAAAKDDPLQMQLYQSAIQRDGVVATGTFEQFTERAYNEGKKDTMQFIKPDVSTLCIGQAASMGAFLLGASENADSCPQICPRLCPAVNGR